MKEIFSQISALHNPLPNLPLVLQGWYSLVNNFNACFRAMTDCIDILYRIPPGELWVFMGQKPRADSSKGDFFEPLQQYKKLAADTWQKWTGNGNMAEKFESQHLRCIGEGKSLETSLKQRNGDLAAIFAGAMALLADPAAQTANRIFSPGGALEKLIAGMRS